MSLHTFHDISQIGNDHTKYGATLVIVYSGVFG